MQPELQRIDGGTQPGIDTGYGTAAAAPEAQKVLRNTYLLLALTMVPTTVGAWIGIQVAPAIQAHPILSFFLMLGSVIGLQFGIAAYRNSGIGVALLLLMTGALGVFIGPLLNFALAMKNGAALVGYAALGTGAIFAGMAAIATVTKRDFSFMGKFLFVGMIAVLCAGIANLFLQMPVLGLVIATLVLVIFSLFLLHDLSRIVTGGETNYVMAATGVYLSLLNVFTSLLQILLSLAGDRD